MNLNQESITEINLSKSHVCNIKLHTPKQPMGQREIKICTKDWNDRVSCLAYIVNKFYMI